MSFSEFETNQPPLFADLIDVTDEPQRGAVRAKRRAAQWQQGITKDASYASRRARSEDDRARVWQAYEEEIERGPDFTRYHGESDFIAPPKITADRNALARIRFKLVGIAKGSWAKKEKGKHAGLVQHSTIRVFDALCSLAKKHGRVFPSLVGLAYLAQCSRNTVLSAIKQLAFFGFITVHRRIKRVPTPLGFRVEQDTNAYNIQEPNSFGQIALRLFGFVKESNNWEASPSNSLFDKSKGRNSALQRPSGGTWGDLHEIWEAS